MDMVDLPWSWRRLFGESKTWCIRDQMSLCERERHKTRLCKWISIQGELPEQHFKIYLPPYIWTSPGSCASLPPTWVWGYCLLSLHTPQLLLLLQNDDQVWFWHKTCLSERRNIIIAGVSTFRPGNVLSRQQGTWENSKKWFPKHCCTRKSPFTTCRRTFKHSHHDLPSKCYQYNKE